MKGITVVGCGTMGSALIRALMNGGMDVTIVDISDAKAKEFIERGARYYKSLDDSDTNNIIIINLPNHKLARSVVLAADKEKMKGRMIINTTTSSPDEVKDMDSIASELGMKHLDAKIENYPGDIGSQAAYLLYSGSEEVYEAAKPALEALGQVGYLGEDIIGASLIDTAVVEVHFGAIATLAEAAAYCIKLDYPVDKMVDQMRKALPIMFEGNLRTFGTELQNYTGEFEDATECTVNMETIAMETILSGINGAGVKTPVGDAILKLFRDARANGSEKKNIVTIVNELM